MTLTGFAVCTHFCAHKLIRTRSYVVIPQIGIAMGFLLQIRMSWLRALSKGCRCWCCGPGRWCCELAERAFKTGGGAGRVLAPLPVFLGLCWCNFFPKMCEDPAGHAFSVGRMTKNGEKNPGPSPSKKKWQRAAWQLRGVSCLVVGTPVFPLTR